MQNVLVKKTELLVVLRANRDSHKAIFDEAQTKYREEVIKELEKRLAEARSGARIRRSLTLIEPVDQTREYDQAIRMLEMSQEEEITLTHQDFKCFVLDEWNWKRQFLVSNATYSKTAEDFAAASGYEVSEP